MNDVRKALEKAYSGKEKEEVVESDGDSIEDLVENEEVSEEDIDLKADDSKEEDIEELDVPNEESEEEFEEREASQEEELEPVNPPQFWKEANKQAFNQLPRELQEQVVQLDKERQGYITQLSQRASTLENAVNSVNEAIAPYQDIIVEAGGDPVSYIKSLFHWDSHIRNNPVEGIQRLMHINGVGIDQLAETEQRVDPQVRQLEQKYASLEQQLLAKEREQQQAQEKQLLLEVQAFEGEADSNGAPLRPHLQDERVIREMISQVPIVRNSNPHLTNHQILDEAYNRSISIYGLNRAVNKPEKKVTSIKEAKKNQAKKVASSVTGSGTSGNPKTKADTTREAIELSLQQLGM